MYVTDAQKLAMKEAFRKSITTTTTRGIRKSVDHDGTTQEDQPFSISKYLRGACLQNWSNAKIEKAAFDFAKTEDYTTDAGSRAGYLVPTAVDAAVIPRLAAKSTVRQMPGVQIVDLGGQVVRDYTGVDSGVSLSWGTEAASISQDDSFDVARLRLETSKCVARLRVSRELIDSPGADADRVITDELVKELAVEEDRVMLRGLGGTQPLGIYNQPRVHSTDLSGEIDQDDLTTASLAVEASNSEITGWVSSPQVRNRIRKLKDANGNYLLALTGFGTAGKELLDAGSLFGRVFRCTTAVPATGYPDTDESFLIGANWADLLIGDGRLRIESNPYTNWDNDLISIRLVKRIGFILKHAASFVVIKGITVS